MNEVREREDVSKWRFHGWVSTKRNIDCIKLEFASSSAETSEKMKNNVVLWQIDMIARWYEQVYSGDQASLDIFAGGSIQMMRGTFFPKHFNGKNFSRGTPFKALKGLLKLQNIEAVFTLNFPLQPGYLEGDLQRCEWWNSSHFFYSFRVEEMCEIHNWNICSFDSHCRDVFKGNCADWRLSGVQVSADISFEVLFSFAITTTELYWTRNMNT